MAFETQPLDIKESRKRKREWFAIVMLVILLVALTLTEFRLTRLSSTLPFVNSMFFFGLLNVNLILLLGLVWLIFRNIGKLFIERRRKILGARLKTKLVLAFLAFSMIPTLVLFAISAAYINSSFDKWFSIKIQNTLQASLDITGTYYRNTDQNALHFASQIAAAVAKVPTADIESLLRERQETLALDAVEYYPGFFSDRVVANRNPSDDYPRVSMDYLVKGFKGEPASMILHTENGDLIRCLAPVQESARAGGTNGAVTGVVVVSSFIPVSLVNKAYEIASVLDDYKATNPLKYPMKTTYLVILIMITLVILFVAIWIGLYMARELTVPVERLVYAAQAVGAGNLEVKLLPGGHDELGVLVASFNTMIQDLRENRAQLTEASEDLERRRLQLETILANVGTGVISVDASRKVTTVNRAAFALLEFGEKSDPASMIASMIGRDFRSALAQHEILIELIEEVFLQSGSMDRHAPRVLQWTARSGELTRSLAAIVTPLQETHGKWGIVAVIDDMTQMIKSQREMAWREVARRIAHEIKNPLTPIKLSAQRLQRRLMSTVGKEKDLVKECTDTIIRHTDELKELVNEFSNFARLPEINSARNNLTETAEEVVSLYRQAHPMIAVRLEKDPKLPLFDFDKDQLKRVLINLVENAVGALSESTTAEVTEARDARIDISLKYIENLEIASIEVRDNGCGIPDEARERIFEPYFSTRREGTGLGLAIAKRIVNDHDGFIRVSSEPGKGACFTIELPTRGAVRDDARGENVQDSSHHRR